MATGDTQQSRVAEALDRLWRQYLPVIEERVTVIENAARILGERELTDNERAAANNAAHKLAGVLGSFGLTTGTALAREAETLYSGDPNLGIAGAGAEDMERLAKIAAQLKAMIAGQR